MQNSCTLKDPKNALGKPSKKQNSKSELPLVAQKFQQFYKRGEFGLLVELHREGLHLQPVQQAC